LATVAFGGTKQTDARLMAAHHIGEPGRLVLTRLLTVGHEVFEQQSAALQVEYPQTPFGRRQRKIDHGQSLRRPRAVVHRTLHGRHRMREYLAIQGRRSDREAGDHRLIGRAGRLYRRQHEKTGDKEQASDEHGHLGETPWAPRSDRPKARLSPASGETGQTYAERAPLVWRNVL